MSCTDRRLLIVDQETREPRTFYQSTERPLYINVLPFLPLYKNSKRSRRTAGNGTTSSSVQVSRCYGIIYKKGVMLHLGTLVPASISPRGQRAG